MAYIDLLLTNQRSPRLSDNQAYDEYDHKSTHMSRKQTLDKQVADVLNMGDVTNTMIFFFVSGRCIIIN